jgi:uncharacterized protein (TIGR00369 family)
MKKILNPFVKHHPHDYKCFGCSPANDIGLHLEFFDAGEEVVAKWEPQKRFEGYFNVLHGGIQATILDEIAAWVVNVKCKTAGVTSSMSVKYRQPIYLDSGVLTIRGRVEAANRRLATIRATIENSEGKVLAEAEVVYFLFSEQDAKEKYYYPGVDAFYE